ncbi:hypothetical protein TRVL_05218 [Trypanosoma vivax]|nr:hypothetical protein TRVL_05218 [Trypanosoma vivax]
MAYDGCGRASKRVDWDRRGWCFSFQNVEVAVKFSLSAAASQPRLPFFTPIYSCFSPSRFAPLLSLAPLVISFLFHFFSFLFLAFTYICFWLFIFPARFCTQKRHAAPAGRKCFALQETEMTEQSGVVVCELRAREKHFRCSRWQAEGDATVFLFDWLFYIDSSKHA